MLFPLHLGFKSPPQTPSSGPSCASVRSTSDPEEHPARRPSEAGWHDSVHIPNLNLGRSPLPSLLQNPGEASAWKQLSPKGGGGTDGSPARTSVRSYTSARVT